MLDYTSRQVTQLIRQYEMFLKSADIIENNEDKEKIYQQMNKIKEKLIEQTNIIYEEEYNKLLDTKTSLISEEKEKLTKIIDLIENRILYVNEQRKQHQELTNYSISYSTVLGEDKLREFKKHIKIIDKFNENKEKENILSHEINELDSKISEAIKKIKNNKFLNTSLEKKMISLLTKTFDKLELYKLTEEKVQIDEEFSELEFSLKKAKENVKKAKQQNKDEIKLECDSLLSSVTLEYEKVKEKKYILRLMEIYDIVISDYEQLLNKREEMNDILNEISSSYLYGIIGEELNKQYNTIKIEKQDMSTYETLVNEREYKYNELEKITEENNSEEFRNILDELLVNEKKRQEEILKEKRKQEYEERQRKLIEDKRLEDERRKRQQLILDERKKQQENLSKQLLEQQRKTVIKESNETLNDLSNKNKVSFNSVLEADSIPIIKNNKLTPEKVGVDKALKENVNASSVFDKENNIFPELGNNRE